MKRNGSFLDDTQIVDNQVYTVFSVAIAKRSHPFPSRTRKLSSSAPMVLHGRLCGRVGRRRKSLESPESNTNPIGSGLFLPAVLSTEKNTQGAKKQVDRYMVDPI